jgi:drug/metabolite transporter (DMT)-like permease
MLLSGRSILQFQLPNNSWVPLLLTLGIIFVLGFNAFARTIQSFSVTIATIVQRMSMIIVILYAIFFYEEPLGLLKILGLLIGILSIFLITGKPKNTAKKKLFHFSWLWFFLLLTFIISGGIDTTFLIINRQALTLGYEKEFGTLLFLSAGIFGACHFFLIQSTTKKTISKKEVLAGIALGIPNFLTIYFIQMMLHTGWDGSTIFPICNVGVMVLSAFLSRLIFRESFQWMKIFGILFAVLSIVLLSIDI